MDTQKLEEYKRQIQESQDRYNQSIEEKFRSGRKRCPHCGQTLVFKERNCEGPDLPEYEEEQERLEAEHTKISLAMDSLKERIVEEMLDDPEMKDLVCTHTITFFYNEDHCDGNYELDKELDKAFPLVLTDSESSQGFAYCPASIVEEVVAWLKDGRAVEARYYKNDRDMYSINWKAAGLTTA